VIYEGDQNGGFFRGELQGSPFIKNFVMTTNHYLVYGCDPNSPGTNFGLPLDFDSACRYEMGASLSLFMDKYNMVQSFFSIVFLCFFPYFYVLSFS
jgi:hypothetical protein